VNCDERVRAIALAGKELAQLEFFELVNETIVLCNNFALGLRAMRFVFLFGRELMKRVEIFDLAFKLVKRMISDRRRETSSTSL